MTRGWSIQCLLRWLEVREAEGHPFPDSVRKLKEDIDHSALLGRLLSGQEPLDDPPPKTMAYPWYEIIEKGKGEPSQVWEAQSDLVSALGFKAIIIDGYPWRILEKVSEEEYLVTYGKNGSVWVARVVGVREDIQERLRDGKVEPGLAHLSKRWALEKIGESEEANENRAAK